MELIITLDDIENQAKKFISYLGNVRVATFTGPMGAGKTTFIHAVCNQLQVTDKMSSPTYSIINQYKTKEGETINHIDLYRLKDVEEAIKAGVEETINSGDLCFIEWPEKIVFILPLHVLNIFIEIIDDTRRRLVMKLT